MGTGISDLYFTSLRLDKGEDLSSLEVEKTRQDAAARLDPGTSQRREARQSVGDSLAEALSRKIERFETALARFSWPSQTSPWYEARLVLEGGAMEGKVQAETAPAGQAVPFEKYFSRGKSAQAASGVDPGAYVLTLSQGANSVNLEVEIASGDSWGEALGKVKEAVNQSGLSVRADLVLQNAPFSLNPQLATTGTVLALSVNPERQDQNVSLRDVSGHLVKKLGLTQMPAQTSPATPESYAVGAPQQSVIPTYASAAFDPNAPTTLAIGRHDFAYAIGTGPQKTSYVSKVFDPTAATSLAPGDYDFSYKFGDESKTMTVTVKSGATWGDVLRSVAANVNAETAWTSTTATPPYPSGIIPVASSFSQPGLEAQLDRADIASTAQAGVFTDGQILTIATTDPRKGESLTLTDGAQGLLASLGLTAKLTGETAAVTVQKDMTWSDVVEQLTTVVSQASTRLDARAAIVSDPSYALPNERVPRAGLTATVSLRDQRLGEPLVLSDGASDLLSSLGMRSSTPGQDGVIGVNGRQMVSENDAYALDQGRLRFTVEEPFGETLPLKVVSALSEIEDRMGSVVASYDDIRKFLYTNRDFFTRGLAERLEGPVSANWRGLSELGFVRGGRDGALWINRDRFWRTLTADGPGAEKTLWNEPTGLVPGWKDVAAGLRRTGPAEFLTPETRLLESRPRSMSEFELERKYRLLNLLG